jgi:hypothetical protein
MKRRARKSSAYSGCCMEAPFAHVAVAALACSAALMLPAGSFAQNTVAVEVVNPASTPVEVSIFDHICSFEAFVGVIDATGSKQVPACATGDLAADLTVRNQTRA